MIIISCINCGKPIEVDHAYKIQNGLAAHVKCDAPMASSGSGKTIEFTSTREDGSRTPGSGEK